MTASPSRQPDPPKPRPLASTVLLYASLMVVMIGLVVGWQWYKRHRARRSQDAAASSAPAALAPMGPVGQTPPPGAAAPATAPATAPTTRGAEPDPPGSPNISPMAIELTATERAALGGVRDFIHRLQETAFFLLLGRAAKMPTLSPEDYADLPRIKTADILNRPGLYRAQKMRLKVRVFSVRKLEAGEDMTPHRAWPVGSTAWELHAMDDVPRGQQSHAMILFLTTDPSQVLGEPLKTLRGGEMQYHPRTGKRLELAGLFYKVHMTRDRGDAGQASTLREYPVFIAWQIATPAAGGGQSWGMAAAFGMIGLVMLVGFIVLKRYLRQIRKGGSDYAARYRPLRDTLRAEAASEALAAAERDEAGALPEPRAEATPPEQTQVDPLLQQAAEDYRRDKREKEREQADEQNGSG